MARRAADLGDVETRGRVPEDAPRPPTDSQVTGRGRDVERSGTNGLKCRARYACSSVVGAVTEEPIPPRRITLDVRKKTMTAKHHAAHNDRPLGARRRALISMRPTRFMPATIAMRHQAMTTVPAVPRRTRRN